MADLIGTLIERQAKIQAEARGSAAETCRALLLRNSAPRANDEGALADALGVLGRNPEDLASDLALVEQLAQAESLAAKVDSLYAEAQRATVEVARVEQKLERERLAFAERQQTKLDTARASASQAEHEWSLTKRAQSESPTLKDKWEALAGGVSVEEVRAARLAQSEPAKPARHGPTGPVV